MIIHDVTQGGDEWKRLRAGLPTASEFDKIVTTTGKPSTQYDAYINKLLAEIITGKPVDTFEGNAHTERGNELEPAAVAFYELQRDVEAVKVGFVTNDEGTYGCSPDRLLGDDGLLEVKCPAPHTHVGYLLNPNVDRKYYPQLQGQLLVTGRQWVDIISYHPEIQPVIIRVERDLKFLEELSRLLRDFTAALNERKAKLIDKGYLK